MQAALALLEENEFLALRAIFPDSLSIPAHVSEDGLLRICVGGLAAEATLLLDPLRYPAVPPLCEVEGLGRGACAGVLGAVRALGQQHAGSAMLFELVQALREQLGRPAEPGAEPQAALPLAEADEGCGGGEARAPAQQRTVAYLSGPLETERRSVFQGHAAAVDSVEQVRAVLAHIASLPRVARATHPCMYAYRIPAGGGGGAAAADNDDDGESGAGAKLAQLLVNMGVSAGALVVVTRWYGGIPLGPSRFAVIANVARKALIEAGLGGGRK
jgi:hypothetical protein